MAFKNKFDAQRKAAGLDINVNQYGHTPEQVAAAISRANEYISQLNKEKDYIEKYKTFISTAEQLKGEWESVQSSLQSASSAFLGGGLNIKGKDPTSGKILEPTKLAIDGKINTIISLANPKKQEHIDKYQETAKKAEDLWREYHPDEGVPRCDIIANF